MGDTFLSIIIKMLIVILIIYDIIKKVVFVEKFDIFLFFSILII